MHIDLMAIHQPTENDQRFISIKVWPGFRLSTEIHIANAKSRPLQQRIQSTQRFVGNVLKHENFGSGHNQIPDFRRIGAEGFFIRIVAGALNQILICTPWVVDLKCPRAGFTAIPWNYADRTCSDIAVTPINLHGFRPLDRNKTPKKQRHSGFSFCNGVCVKCHCRKPYDSCAAH